MNAHAQFEAMLVCPDELSLAERMGLEAHLAGCAACRSLEAIYAENRARLRAMAQVRPPEELRAAILAAAESSRPIFGGMAMLLPFGIIPLALLLLYVGITFGWIAWLAIILGLVVFTVGTAWFADRRASRSQELPLEFEPGSGLREMARAIGWDTIGIGLGMGLIVLLVLAATQLGGH